MVFPSQPSGQQNKGAVRSCQRPEAAPRGPGLGLPPGVFVWRWKWSGQVSSRARFSLSKTERIVSLPKPLPLIVTFWGKGGGEAVCEV